jgi:hypothetical protein
VKYAVEMGSDTIIYILSFTKIGAGSQKLIGRGVDSQEYRHHGVGINLI